MRVDKKEAAQAQANSPWMRDLLKITQDLRFSLDSPLNSDQLIRLAEKLKTLSRMRKFQEIFGSITWFVQNSVNNLIPKLTSWLKWPQLATNTS